MSDDPSENKENEQDLAEKERQQNKELSDRMMGLFTSSKNTTTEKFENEDGSSLVEIMLELRSTPDNQVLERLGYGLVGIGRIIDYNPDGSIHYPVVSTISSFDTQNNSINTFALDENEDGTVDLTIWDEDRTIPLGFDKETGLPTTDIMQFDPDFSDEGPSDGVMPSSRPLDGGEIATLLSVLTACESTVADEQS